MMKSKRPHTNNDESSKSQGFGPRFKEIAGEIASTLPTKRVALEQRIAANVGFMPDRFRRWYTEENSLDVKILCQIIEQLEIHAEYPIDLDYLMFGREPTRVRDEAITAMSNKVDRTYERVEDMFSYMQDHELGVDNVVMRQSIRLLEDIQYSRKHRRSTDPLSGSQRPEMQEPPIAGYLPDDLVQIIESCTTHSRIASLRFDYQSDTDSESDHYNSRMRRFFPIIASNLQEGRKYDYLVPAGGKEIINRIDDFRQALVSPRQGNVPRASMKNLRFFTTELPLGASFMLMDFNFQALKNRRHFLAEEIAADYVDLSQKPHCLGKVLSPAKRTHGGVLMDPERTTQAQKAWDLYMGDCIQV